MPNQFRRWTEDDVDKLRNMARKMPTADIAAKLGRSVGATTVKAHQLKLSLKVLQHSVPQVGQALHAETQEQEHEGIPETGAHR